jgi:uncharacterized protein YneF (UPF0154 family)
MNMILLNSLMVILLCTNGFLAGMLIATFIARNLYSTVVAKELKTRERTIEQQKALIKQMQEKGTVKVEVTTQANEDLDFPKG